MAKNYLNSVDFTYEILISQGRGKLTDKSYRMLLLLSEKMINKFDYRGDNDLKYDCKMTGLMQMLLNWEQFNGEKYSDAFPFFSEICKRGIARGLKVNTETVKNSSSYFSLDNMNGATGK